MEELQFSGTLQDILIMLCRLLSELPVAASPPASPADWAQGPILLSGCSSVSVGMGDQVLSQEVRLCMTVFYVVFVCVNQ